MALCFRSKGQQEVRAYRKRATARSASGSGACGKAAGLTQEELAEHAGLTPEAVGVLEHGARRHPDPTTARAARLLGGGGGAV